MARLHCGSCPRVYPPGTTPQITDAFSFHRRRSHCACSPGRSKALGSRRGCIQEGISVGTERFCNARSVAQNEALPG